MNKTTPQHEHVSLKQLTHVVKNLAYVTQE